MNDCLACTNCREPLVRLSYLRVRIGFRDVRAEIWKCPKCGRWYERKSLGDQDNWLPLIPTQPGKSVLG